MLGTELLAVTTMPLIQLGIQNIRFLARVDNTPRRASVLSTS